MLKTNSKKARENIRAYILANENTAEYCNYPVDSTDFSAVAKAIYSDFFRCYNNDYNRRTYPEAEYFPEWAAGLPSILDTCYYYNRSAIDDLAEILQQTPEEKARFTDEQKAEKLLSQLIYREIKREV